MSKKLTVDELCHAIAIEIAQWNPESLEELACHIFLDHVKYLGDGVFERGNLDELRLKPVEST